MNKSTEHQTTDRVERLRERMNRDAHGVHRIACPSDWSVADKDCSLAERRAHSLHMACERMPIAIEPDELIVGLTSLLGGGGRPFSNLPVFFRDDAEAESVDSARATSHNVPGFDKLMRQGLAALAAKAKANLACVSEENKRSYLSSFVIACDAVAVLLRRYAQQAARQAEEVHEAHRRAELKRIAETCTHLIDGAPRDLQDALQFYWISWSLIVVEVGCLVSMGRIDQVLAPYWPTDPTERAGAQELIDCFIIKCNDQNKLWAGSSLINNQVMLSGLTRDGSDATNPVTWAVLSALDRLNMPDPQPAVRLHDRSPAELLHAVCRLWRDGRSQISVYNDDAFVPALQGAGIQAADARDYAIDACQDVSIFGRSDFFLGGHIAMAGLLLRAMDTTPAPDCNSLLSTYKDLIATAAADQCNGYSKRIQDTLGLPCPLLSVSMDNCIETGLDMANGGLAIRDKGVMLGEPVVMINSLAAIRKVVYEDGAATLAEVSEACKANWLGHEDLQRKLQDAPKWGNDDDAVDLPGAEIFRFASEEIWKHRMPDGSRFLSGIHQAHHVSAGHGMAATPDGRSRGQPMSPTLAPANGTAKKGPTAVMKSVTKIDPMVSQWNSSLTMVFDPTGLRGDEGLAKFEALLRTWLKLRGPQLQVNVVSEEMLQAAKADPNRYRDLIVRVWGFCDRFVSLQPIYQDELIDRARNGMQTESSCR